MHWKRLVHVAVEGPEMVYTTQYIQSNLLACSTTVGHE